MEIGEVFEEWDESEMEVIATVESSLLEEEEEESAPKPEDDEEEGFDDEDEDESSFNVASVKRFTILWAS